MMNRQEEYKALLTELDQEPPALAFAVERAKHRANRRKTLRFFGVPAASLGGLFAAFVLLVNLSTPFALACVDVPFLKELMAAVAVSPSLKTMVQNDFIQPVNLTKTDGEAQMTIHYLAYDGIQVNIFYTATYGGSEQVEIWPQYATQDRTDLFGISFSTGMPTEKGEMGHMTVDLHREEMPDVLCLTAQFLRHGEPEEGMAPENSGWRGPEEESAWPVAAVTFDLELDPRFTRAKRVYTPQTTLDLDGRQVVLERVSVYPTGTRLDFSDGPDNDAWLKGLDLWLEDGAGHRFESRRDGIVSVGGTGEFIPTYWLDSVYFQPGDDLTLCISEVRWLEKDWQTATLDFNDPGASELPHGVEFRGVERLDGDVKLLFWEEGENSSAIAGTYYTPEGETRQINTWGYRELDEKEDGEGGGIGYTYLWDYPWDTVEITLNHSQVTHLDTPLRVPLAP